MGGRERDGTDALATIQKWIEGVAEDGIEWCSRPSGSRKPSHCTRCGQVDCAFRGRRDKECARGRMCGCEWCVWSRSERVQAPLVASQKRMVSRSGFTRLVMGQ